MFGIIPASPLFMCVEAMCGFFCGIPQKCGKSPLYRIWHGGMCLCVSHCFSVCFCYIARFGTDFVILKGEQKNKKKMKTLIIILIATIGLNFTAFAAIEQDATTMDSIQVKPVTVIETEELPEAVKEAFEQSYPKAVANEIQTNGSVYKIAYTNADGSCGSTLFESTGNEM